MSNAFFRRSHSRQPGRLRIRTSLIVAAALICLTIAFARTGLVYDEGGFGVRLVLKPEMSSQVVFGGGEEGQWRRHHAGGPTPWWQRADVRVLIDGDWEEGDPLWVGLYKWGAVVLILLLWPLSCLWGLWKGGRALLRNRHARSGA